MLQYMHSARKSLDALQLEATAALGEASILRGNTCPAISYRVFLQLMACNNSSGRQENRDDSSKSVLEKVTLVVEDSNYAWRILANGNVQVSAFSHANVLVT